MIFLSPAFSVLTQTRRVFLWHSTTYIRVHDVMFIYKNIIYQCFVMVIIKLNPFHLLRYISIHKTTESVSILNIYNVKRSLSQTFHRQVYWNLMYPYVAILFNGVFNLTFFRIINCIYNVIWTKIWFADCPCKGFRLAGRAELVI